MVAINDIYTSLLMGKKRNMGVFVSVCVCLYDTQFKEDKCYDRHIKSKRKKEGKKIQS